MEKVMVIVNNQLVLDYAYPCMKTEKSLKNLHNAAIENRFDDAIECGLIALAELKLTINALKEMKNVKNRLVVQQSENISAVPQEVLPLESCKGCEG